jgi:hypothetical protein
MNHETHLVDNNRSADLDDVGFAGYVAAVVVASDGHEHLLLAQRKSFGDETARFDPLCTDAAHEQLEQPLPADMVARIASIPECVHRCGRRTASGEPCLARVRGPGDACTWHAEASR